MMPYDQIIDNTLRTLSDRITHLLFIAAKVYIIFLVNFINIFVSQYIEYKYVYAHGVGQ